ncbi:hypothetical protein D9757_005242 [Collybiopsis confluens]|uniref:3-keto sterol reductase n=1 Tax=Collybiopsis confluens TaxID=2823264 RepID=A0A8H5HVW6_9AGAR|nr:hypothetical protein D9757_005242 [Collybiopsis confluens]
MAWPIVVVTGANAGVGFGICQRLLCQLAERTPSDTFIIPKELELSVYHNHENEGESVREADQFPLPCEGLTIIMACRSVQRAEEAKEKLFKILDGRIENLRKGKARAVDDDEHAERFRRNVRIEIRKVDLAELNSIATFTKGLENEFPYISHLICNAGIAPFKAIDWPRCFYQLFTDIVGAVTNPKFYSQTWGEVSQDGLGYVWQCNVFGHYTLYRDLHPLLSSSKYPHDSRVIWTSSIESDKTYEDGDWQLLKTQEPYGSSKYQIELMSMELDRRALDDDNDNGDEAGDKSKRKRVRHFTAHPGVTQTNIDHNLMTIPVMHPLKRFLFYLARWFGSQVHNIDLDKGAVSVVWLSIISLSLLSIFSSSSSSSSSASSSNAAGSPKTTAAADTTKTDTDRLNGERGSDNPHPNVRRPAVKFAALTDRWGVSLVGITEIVGGEENSMEAKQLVDYHEKVYIESKSKPAAAGSRR